MSAWMTLHAGEANEYKFDTTLRGHAEVKEPYLECSVRGELAWVTFYLHKPENARMIAAELLKMADKLEAELRPVPADSTAD